MRLSSRCRSCGEYFNDRNPRLREARAALGNRAPESWCGECTWLAWKRWWLRKGSEPTDGDGVPLRFKSLLTAPRA